MTLGFALARTRGRSTSKPGADAADSRRKGGAAGLAHDAAASAPDKAYRQRRPQGTSPSINDVGGWCHTGLPALTDHPILAGPRNRFPVNTVLHQAVHGCRPQLHEDVP